MANKIVAIFHSTAAPSLFLHAACAIHGDLGMIQNEAPATGSKSRNTPEIMVPILKRQASQLVAL